jgi:hypothetical protein
MLDAFIIEKIHRDAESRDRRREVLRIETYREPIREVGEAIETEKPTRRGIEIIDFNI